MKQILIGLAPITPLLKSSPASLLLRRLKVRGSTDVVGVIALILLVLIFLRVFGII